MEIKVRSSPAGLEGLQRLVGANRLGGGDRIVDIGAPADGVYVVAEIGDEPIGCATVGFFDEESCELYRLFVDPAQRSRGVGGRLVCAVESIARERGLRQLCVEVAGSRRFWLKYLLSRRANWISDCHVEIDIETREIA